MYFWSDVVWQRKNFVVWQVQNEFNFTLFLSEWPSDMSFRYLPNRFAHRVYITLERRERTFSAAPRPALRRYSVLGEAVAAGATQKRSFVGRLPADYCAHVRPSRQCTAAAVEFPGGGRVAINQAASKPRGTDCHPATQRPMPCQIDAGLASGTGVTCLNRRRYGNTDQRRCVGQASAGLIYACNIAGDGDRII